MFSFIFSHWYLWAPICFVAYLVIGSIFGAVQEYALRRLDGRARKDLSGSEKALAYILFPCSMLSEHNSFRLFLMFEHFKKGDDETSEDHYRGFRYGTAAAWPLCLFVLPIGWTLHIAWGALLLAWAVIRPIGMFFFDLPESLLAWAKRPRPAKVVIAPMTIPPPEPAAEPSPPTLRSRVVELRTRVATREAELEADKRALHEAEMEFETKEPAYRGLSLPPGE